MIKVILLRAPCQNVNVLLSNITFIIFAVFDVLLRALAVVSSPMSVDNSFRRLAVYSPQSVLP